MNTQRASPVSDDSNYFMTFAKAIAQPIPATDVPRCGDNNIIMKSLYCLRVIAKCR